MSFDLMIQVGDRGGHPSRQVKVPCRFSADRNAMIVACGPGGWFGQAQILAVRDRDGWKSRCGYPLVVTAEKGSDGFWTPVADGRIGL